MGASAHITRAETPDTATFAAGKVIRRQVTSFLSVTPFANESRGGEIMSHRFIVSAIQGVLLSSSFSVLAENVPTVVVSATRSEQSTVTVPSSITVISRAEIVASGAATLSDVFRGRAGIQVSDLFGDGSIVSLGMRGFAQNASSNTLVMVDGRRLNYSDTRSPDLSYIAVQDVERIEIIKGGAGVLFGDQAVAGVINIITRTPKIAETTAELQSGSYNRMGASVYHSNKLDGGLGYKLSASGFQTDNYRDHNEHRNTNLTGYIAQDYASGNVFAEVQKVTDDLQLPGALIQAELDDDRRQINSGFIDDFSNTDTIVSRVGIKQNINNEWSFEAEGTKRDIDQDVRQSFRNNPSPQDGYSSRDLRSVNPRIIGSVPVENGNALITVGADGERAEYYLNLPNVFGTATQANDQTTKSLYAQVVYPATKDLSITAGARYAKVDNEISDTSSYNFTPLNVTVTDSVTIADIGMRYDLTESDSVTLRRDESFRFAKVSEFALADSGNILKTQEGASYEVAYKADRDGYNYEIQFYRMYLENEFFFDPSIGLYGANVNLDETIHDGAVFEYARDISSAAYVSMNYAYTSAEFKSGGLKGNKISGIADRQLGMRLGGQGEVWNGYVELIAIGDKYASGDNLNALKKESGYGVVNTSVALVEKTMDVRLRINNVFNKRYSEFVTDNGYGRAFQPSPERNVMLTVGMKF